MRKLTALEEERLSLLTGKLVELSLIEPTKTGLEKSIMDATIPLRRYLEEQEIHDYDSQKQGTAHKVVIETSLLKEDIIISSRASLYRPTTKKGDPRIWFKNLNAFCKANDILVVIAYQDALHVINLTSTNLDKILNEKKSGPIWELIDEINNSEDEIASELLLKLRKIARKGFVESVLKKRTDTGIGRTLEALLGIKMNSKQTPDYHGIELKSFRRKPNENRKTLFAKVPNWKISQFKSSNEILSNFGYKEGKSFQLNCTVSAKNFNSQGLKLKLTPEELIEYSNKKEIGEFATWLMEDLRKTLKKKHNETFWVAAKTSQKNGVEFFQFTDILHTRKPILSQFDILLEQGHITVDHLIKRSLTKTTGGKEKGPLFKIRSSALEMLFPPSSSYDLLN